MQTISEPNIAVPSGNAYKEAYHWVLRELPEAQKSEILAAKGSNKVPSKLVRDFCKRVITIAEWG